MHQPNQIDQLHESIPPGYRQLDVGEFIAVGDIYWSTKWYRVSASTAICPCAAGWIYARKIDPSHQDNVRAPSADEALFTSVRIHLHALSPESRLDFINRALLNYCPRCGRDRSDDYAMTPCCCSSDAGD